MHSYSFWLLWVLFWLFMCQIQKVKSAWTDQRTNMLYITGLSLQLSLLPSSTYTLTTRNRKGLKLLLKLDKDHIHKRSGDIVGKEKMSSLIWTYFRLTVTLASSIEMSTLDMV